MSELGSARVRRRCVGGKTVDVEVEAEGGVLRKVLISGDFFAYPEGALEDLERALESRKVDRGEILSAIQEVGVDFLGVKPEELVEMILEAAERAELGQRG